MRAAEAESLGARRSGVRCVLGLMVLRLLVVMSAGMGLPLNWREKLLVSWIAPCGIVTAAVASLFALQLQHAGMAAAGPLKGLGLLTILMTAGVGGVTAPWLAKALKCRPRDARAKSLNLFQD